MFDVEKFIECVQTTPVIWEKKSKEYADRILREKSWSIVGKNMFDRWDKMSEDEQMEQVKEMKNKWRHIRDNYSKYIKQGKNGRPIKKKKYLYADALSFLRHTVDNKKRSSKIKQENADSEISSQEEEDANIAEEIIQREPSPTTKKQNLRRVSSTTTTPCQTKEVEKSNNSSKTVEEDADKCFLLSLLPDLKKLNDEQKLDYRLYSLQFFRDLRKNSAP